MQIEPDNGSPEWAIYFVCIGNRKISHPPKTTTARNMGKNDRWIAATASVLDMDLLTSDKDFEHLDGAYIRLAKG